VVSLLKSFWFLALVFALICLPLILSSNPGGYAADETEFHLPAIRQIRAHWPGLDLNRDSLSATAPGYHYALATLSFFTGTGRLPLRVITWCVSLGLLWLLWRLFPAGQRPFAMATLLPLACSNFFVKSASWIVTDNPALLGLAGTMACVLFGRSGWTVWAAGGLAGLTTFVRQLYAWTAAPVALRAIRDMAAGAMQPGRGWKLLAASIPVGVVAVLAHRWGGLVPPVWQTGVSTGGRFSVMPVTYILTVFFSLGIFYYAAVTADEWKTELRSRWALVGGGAGLICAVAGPTNFDVSAGRWGGYFWWCAAHLPVIGGRSVFFLLLAPLGGILLGAMARRLIGQAGQDAGWLWFCAYVSWAVAFLPSRLVFHRYFEPATLVFLIFWIVLLVRSNPSRTRPKPWSLLGLAFGQALLTFVTAYHPSYGPSLMSAG
jgi:hypothetical protein